MEIVKETVLWTILTAFAFGLGVVSDASAAATTQVKVSSFGFDPEDSTSAVKAALASDAKTIVFDDKGSPWVVSETVNLRSDLEVVFEDGVELVARKGAFLGKRDFLISASGVTNVVLRGLGAKGGVARMHRDDYRKAPYKFSEWRHCLAIRNAKNVLVEKMSFLESGGDGIMTGSGTANVTIRDCVCDRNYRQAISVIAANGLLIERCYLAHTKGTPPQAGIDLEPDNPDEPIVGCVIRGCKIEDNAGCGIVFYTDKLDSSTPPVDALVEDCHLIGNSTAFNVNGGGRSHSYVKGLIRVRNCRFEKAERRGIMFSNVPSDSMRVEMEDCTVDGLTSKGGGSEVSVSRSTYLQPPVDGISLKNLKIVQSGAAHPWFVSHMDALSPREVTDFTGNVTVTDVSGQTSEVQLDAAWCAQNMPRKAAALPPARVPFPLKGEVSVVDARPGEMVELPRVFSTIRANYLFYAKKGETCRFRARYAMSKEGAAFRQPLFPPRVFPQPSGRVVSLDSPTSDAPFPLAFVAPRTGFYRLLLGGSDSHRFMLEASSVPVALDVRETPSGLISEKRDPFALYFTVGDEPSAAIVATGSWGSTALSLALVDPTGAEVARNGRIVTWECLKTDASTAPKGLWRIDVAPPNKPKPKFGAMRLDLTGVPGALFLSKDKYWTIKKGETK